jgi:hypothetical protein
VKKEIVHDAAETLSPPLSKVSSAVVAVDMSGKILNTFRPQWLPLQITAEMQN